MYEHVLFSYQFVHCFQRFQFKVSCDFFTVMFEFFSVFQPGGLDSQFSGQCIQSVPSIMCVHALTVFIRTYICWYICK